MYSRPIHRPVSKKKRLMSYNLQPMPGLDDSEGHRFGVNKLLTTNLGLLTAGRDGIVREWDIHTNQNPTCAVKFYGHAGWVTDMVTVSNEQGLISCSNDGTLKLWKMGCYSNDDLTSEVFPIVTFSRHEDYVKTLSYASKVDKLASAGLDRRIILWDIEILTNSQVIKESSNGNAVKEYQDISRQKRGSIYSLDIDETGSIVVSGSTDSMIRVFDARAGKKICKLDGHWDNVRSVQLDKDATRIVSGSSDGTIRVWDLRQQCCMSVYALHEDNRSAIWCMKPSPYSENMYYSGVKGGKVYQTSLSNGKSILVCDHDDDVLDLLPCIAPESKGNDRNIKFSLWTANSRGDVCQWDASRMVESHRNSVFLPESTSGVQEETYLDNVQPTSFGAKARNMLLQYYRNDPNLPYEDDMQDKGRRASQDSIPLNSSQQVENFEFADAGMEPLIDAPSVIIKPKPAIIRQQILGNRIHLLTQDDTQPPTIALWDLTRAIQVRKYKKGVDFESAAEILSSGHMQRICVRNWCSMELRGGLPCVTLSESTVHDGDTYRTDTIWDLGDIDEPTPLFQNEEGVKKIVNDDKVNIGARVLADLLIRWSARKTTSLTELKKEKVSDATVLANVAIAKQAKKSNDHAWSGLIPDQIDVWVIEVEGGCGGMDRILLQRHVGEFSGKEMETVLPIWALDSVLFEDYPSKEQPRVQFFVKPHKSLLDAKEAEVTHKNPIRAINVQSNAHMPSSEQRLTASVQMRMNKVLDYIKNTPDLRSHFGTEMAKMYETEMQQKNDKRENSEEQRRDKKDTCEEQNNDKINKSEAEIIDERIELLCNDEVLSVNTHLGAVHSYIWADNSSHLILNYRKKEPCT